MATRVYMVLDKATLAHYNARPTSDSDLLRHALVSAWTGDDGSVEKLDSVLAWGYNPQNLQTIADARNVDLYNIRQAIDRTLVRDGAGTVQTGVDAPRRRGRPRKVVDNDSVSG